MEDNQSLSSSVGLFRADLRLLDQEQDESKRVMKDSKAEVNASS